MPDALAEILRKAPLNDEKIAFAWRAAVGAAIDPRDDDLARQGRAARARGYRGVAAEVKRSEALIRARLDALLGRGVIRSIEIEVP